VLLPLVSRLWHRFVLQLPLRSQLRLVPLVMLFLQLRFVLLMLPALLAIKTKTLIFTVLVMMMMIPEKISVTSKSDFKPLQLYN
jgi:hypothetical protein